MRNAIHRHLFLVCYLAAGAALYAYATHNGMGITFDSRHYLAAAHSLLHNGTLRNADGTPYTNWPPLYPALLALARANVGYIRAGQVLVLLATLFLTFRLGRHNIRHPALRVFLMGSIVFSAPLLLANVFVWSEGFFVLLTLVAFACLRRCHAAGHTACFWWLVALGNLLCLQRLTGIFFVAAFAPLFFFGGDQRRDNNLRGNNLKKTLLYIVLSLSGVAIWLFRNTFLEATPAFGQNIFVTPPLPSLAAYADALGGWFVPAAAPFAVKLAAGVLWFSGILFCQWRFRFGLNSFFFQANWLALCYLGCMVMAGGEAPETDRFAIPAYAFVFCGIAASLDAVFAVLPARRRAPVVALLFLWLAYPAARVAKNAAFWHHANVQVSPAPPK